MDQFDLKLIAKKLSGELSPGEEKAFERWLNADPGHQVSFKQLEKAWEVSADLYPGYSPDTENEWKKLRARMEPSNARARVVPLYRNRTWLRMAAAVLVFALLGFAVKYLLTDKMPEDLQAVKAGGLPNIQIITSDSLETIYLPDSSKVVLNKNSSISFAKDFSDTARMTYLLGEAYFEVRKNGKPFIVYSEGTQVQVMGTSFDIKANEKEDEIQVAVLEGVVAFRNQGSPPSSAVKLEAGDKINFNKKTKEQKQAKSAGEDLWWKDAKPVKESRFDKKVKKIIMKIKKGFRKK
jgi:transmembrane sensor